MDCISSGFVNQLQQVFSIQERRDPEALASYVAQQGVGYKTSDDRVDVPLRENLDPESRLNRLLARQTYEKERAEKVRKAKEDLEIKFEKDLEDYNKKKAKEEKKREKDKSTNDRNRKDDYQKLQEKRKAVKDSH